MALAALKFPSLQRVAPSASSVTCIHFYSTNPNTSKQPKIHSLKKGTGGRSSFSGIVATVFGSSGFLGRYVCNRLGKIGTQLILPYRGDAGEMLPLKLVGDLGQVLFQPYELINEESIYKSLMYSNTVINLVGRDWETKNYSFEDVHVEGARRIARLARKAGVENFIHVSALNATEYPEPFLLPNGSKWLATKWAGENAVREEFPDAVIFRPSDIYGQEDRFLRYLCGNWRHNFKWMPLYKNGDCTEKQPVHVGDVAGGIVAACKNPHLRGEIIQAVGPNRYLLSELVDWFHRIMRKDQVGYRRYDLRYDPFFLMRFKILPKLSLGWPVGNVHMERLEREIHSDLVDPRMKTLEDLGIQLTKMEEQIPWELKIYKAWSYYDEELGEFEEPIPPKTVRVKLRNHNKIPLHMADGTRHLKGIPNSLQGSEIECLNETTQSVSANTAISQWTMSLFTSFKGIEQDVSDIEEATICIMKSHRFLGFFPRVLAIEGRLYMSSLVRIDDLQFAPGNAVIDEFMERIDYQHVEFPDVTH